MCLGTPAVVASVDYERNIAVVDFGDGVPREVLIGISSERVKTGDLVIVHAGVIVSSLSEEEIKDQIEFFKGVLGEEASVFISRYIVLLERAKEIKG